MAAAAILEFQNLNFFNGRNSQEGQTASRCQISSKSFKPWPRYASFNIITGSALKCLFTPLFGVFWGTFLPNDVTHHPYPKKDHPWTESRHLSHKSRIFSYRFLNWPFKSPLHVFPIGLTLRGPQKWVFGVINMVGVNISNLSSL